MVERIVDIEGRQVRVGSYADAGALIGVNAETARRYASGHATLAVPAPKPITIRDPKDPTGERRVTLRFKGEVQVDLDAWVQWDAGRAGVRGKRGHRAAEVTPETVRRTSGRERLLAGARDGDLRQVRGYQEGKGVTLLAGEPQSARMAQLRSELQDLGVLTEPGPDDWGSDGSYRVRLTADGRRVLARWGLPTEPAKRAARR